MNRALLKGGLRRGHTLQGKDAMETIPQDGMSKRYLNTRIGVSIIVLVMSYSKTTADGTSGAALRDLALKRTNSLKTVRASMWEMAGAARPPFSSERSSWTTKSRPCYRQKWKRSRSWHSGHPLWELSPAVGVKRLVASDEKGFLPLVTCALSFPGPCELYRAWIGTTVVCIIACLKG
jgi:hypothetical protein